MESLVYCRGYLLSSNSNIHIRKSLPEIEPDNWNKQMIGNYVLWVHNKETFYVVKDTNRTIILIGHAYNPFTLQADENDILRTILAITEEKKYWDYIDQLTGLYVLITIRDNGTIDAICDCAGMMGTYYAVIEGKVYISSHAQMIADLFGFIEDPYVRSLKKSKTFHYYGLFLPNDLSPYKEIKRIIPNVEIKIKSNVVEKHRFYPRKTYFETENYHETVKEVADLLHNNLVLISKKWDKPAISLTGGTDSKTTLACAGDIQNKFLYYSYISLPREETDALAAQKICNAIGLEHEIYNIDTNPDHLENFSYFDSLIQRHYGYLGKGNQNDVCKRIGLLNQFHSDIEVKSWVSEVARASRYNIYGIDKMPEHVTPRLLTSMYKVFTYDRWNALRTDKHFKDYLIGTQLRERIERTGYPWSEFFVWEIVFGGWGGLTLSCEHKVSNNITVPYNNRAILDKMLRTPLEKRKTDQLHRDIMDYMDPRINRLGIHVVNENETKIRHMMEKLYFLLHSHIPF